MIKKVFLSVFVLSTLLLSGCFHSDPGVPISVQHFQSIYRAGKIEKLVYTEGIVFITLKKEALSEYEPLFNNALKNGTIKSRNDAFLHLKVAGLAHLKREIAEIKKTNPFVKEVPLILMDSK